MLQWGIRHNKGGWDIMFQFGGGPWRVHGNRNAGLGFKPFKSASKASEWAHEYMRHAGGEYKGKV